MPDDPKKKDEKKGIFTRIKNWFKDAGKWIETHFDSALGHEMRADLGLAPAALAHLGGHRQPGNDMAARAGSHDEQVRSGHAHARPPRMSCLLWLRRNDSTDGCAIRTLLALRFSKLLMRGLRA